MEHESVISTPDGAEPIRPDSVRFSDTETAQNMGRGVVRIRDHYTGATSYHFRRRLVADGNGRHRMGWTGCTLEIERPDGSRHCIRLPDSVGYLAGWIAYAATRHSCSLHVAGNWIDATSEADARVILGPDKGAPVFL
jgi:hypothetical protein